MQKYLLIAFVIPLALLTPAEAKSMATAGGMFASCTSTVKIESDVCAVYMAGFLAGVNMEQISRGDGHQKTCLPLGITGARVKTIFEGFMRDYPKVQELEKEENTKHLLELTIAMALFRAYPCPGAIK